MNVFYGAMKEIECAKITLQNGRKSWQIVNKDRIEMAMKL